MGDGIKTTRTKSTTLFSLKNESDFLCLSTSLRIFSRSKFKKRDAAQSEI